MRIFLDPRPRGGDGCGLMYTPWTRFFRQTFAALKYPNYRIWFVGQTLSLLGTWMQHTALGFLMFELTRSSAYLGYIGFATGAPTWFFMLYAGVVAERMPQRTMLYATQTAMMALAFILAGLTFSGLIQPWHILVIAFLLGIAIAFDAPARQTFVTELVPLENLTNAIALNSTMFNLGAALGPTLAGLTYAAFSPAWCFTINGISFLAVLSALAAMQLKPRPVRHHTGSTLDELKTGLRYVASHTVIRPIIVMVAVATLFGFSFFILVPAWAVKILGGDATTNGILQSARGVGAVWSALTIAYLGQNGRKGRMLTVGTFALPLMLFVFAFARILPLSLVVMTGMGASFILILNLSNSLIQGLVSDGFRARTMSVFTMVYFGLLPVGSLWMGYAAETVGERGAALISAAAILALALALWLLAPQVRRQP